MIADSSPFLINLLTDSVVIFKILFILFAILYFIFTLIIIRQIFLMTETVQTQGGAFIRGFSIVYAGLALGVVILFIGFF